ncbi:MAG: MerR family transcriptional regulator [Deltaproteobacteria bacterium]|nr:MerR family transcriptional regulator [Deltaproteobacteria bacterium]
MGRLARETGKTVRAIHLYDELGLLVPISRSKGGYRLYGSDALVRVRWIAKLQEMGFSLGEIQEIVRDWERITSAPSAMTRVRALYIEKLRDTRAQLARLRALEAELESSLEYLETCETACDPSRVLSVCPQCDLHGCASAPELVAGFHATQSIADSPTPLLGVTPTRAPEPRTDLGRGGDRSPPSPR